ncbi:MAG TPA: hypothetical protein PKH31_03035 [Candidatus Sumerlaeota bacterium]|nr:hypothetical protein [Candidatus Sumerlaeota bacterium]
MPVIHPFRQSILNILKGNQVVFQVFGFNDICRKPDVRDSYPSTDLRTNSLNHPQLGQANRDGFRRHNTGPFCFSRIAVQARGNVNCNNCLVERIHGGDCFPKTSSRRPFQAGSQDCIYQYIAIGENFFHPLNAVSVKYHNVIGQPFKIGSTRFAEIISRRQHDQGNLNSFFSQSPCYDQTVSRVVSFSRHNSHFFRVPIFQKTISDLGPGPLHQFNAGNFVLLNSPEIYFFHFLSRDQFYRHF